MRLCSLLTGKRDGVLFYVRSGPFLTDNGVFDMRSNKTSFKNDNNLENDLIKCIEDTTVIYVVCTSIL